MTQTPEGKVKAAIKKLFLIHDVEFFMPVQTGYGAVELDFIATHPHTKRTFYVETKAPGGYLSARQGALIERHEKRGIPSYVIDGEETARSAGQGYFITPLSLFELILKTKES